MPKEKTLLDEFALAVMQGDFASQLGHLDANQIEEGYIRERIQIYYAIARIAMDVREDGKVTPFPRA